MAIDWNLALRPSSSENALAQGLQIGAQMRQRREQEDRRNALSAYAIDPGNEKNFNALAMAAPEIAMQVRGQRDEAARMAAERDVRRRAAMGEPAAMAELAGIDLPAWRGLNSDQQAAEARNTQEIGQAAQYIATLPPEQRAAAWDQQVQILSQTNSALSRYLGQYSDANLQAVIARAGAFNEFYLRSQPQPFNVGPGEGRYERSPITGEIRTVVAPNLVGAPAFSPAPQTGSSPAQQAPTQMRITPREYQALVQRYGPEQVAQRIGSGMAIVTVTSPDEARTLPSGTRILLPDGTEGRVP